MFEALRSEGDEYAPEVLGLALELAIEIAREGREGRRVGTLFTLGHHELVMPLARPLILDPLSAHPEEARSLYDRGLRGTVKELAQLDGAFVLRHDGVVMGACRYLDAPTHGVDVSLGLGSRHLAGAAISRATGATAIVVSESAVVRLFKQGQLRAEILPELWLFERYARRGRIEQHAKESLAIAPAEVARAKELGAARGRSPGASPATGELAGQA